MDLKTGEVQWTKFGRLVESQHSWVGLYKTFRGWTRRAEKLNEAAMKLEKLFVYGTLRANERANELLGRDASFLSDALTLPKFTLYQIDWYPGLTEGGHTSVKGEIWEINPKEWPKLDEYEGVPDDYLRKPIVLSDGTSAQTYIYIGSIEHARMLESGDWITR